MPRVCKRRRFSEKVGGFFLFYVPKSTRAYTYIIKTEKSAIRKRDLKRAGKEGAASMSLGPKGTWGLGGRQGRGWPS